MNPFFKAYTTLENGGEVEKQALNAAMNEAYQLIIQYRNDLRHPPAPDSKERRLKWIDQALGPINPVKRVIPTYWCSHCGKTSVAEQDDEGNIACPAEGCPSHP